jgi:hypothetical protein
MYLSKVTGNILNKFNNQPINVLYEPQKNLFDVILSQCDIRLFAHKNNINFLKLESSNLTLVNDDQHNLFNYNVGMTNSILEYSTNKIFDTMHLNSMIFTHSLKPSQIKKEDIALLNSNLQKNIKVFFTESAADSWRLDNRVIYNYGIPVDKFYNTKQNRENKVLILNYNNFSNIETLRQFLNSKGIHTDIVTQLNFDTSMLNELFNQYQICIDLNEFNIINLLTALASGCSVVTYATPMMVNSYGDVPNLYMAKTVEDLVSSIQYAMNTPHIDCSEYLAKNYPFDVFKNNITSLVERLNNEVYIK